MDKYDVNITDKGIVMSLNTTTYVIYLLSVPFKSILTLPCLVALMTCVFILPTTKFNMHCIIHFIAHATFTCLAHPVYKYKYVKAYMGGKICM